MIEKIKEILKKIRDVFRKNHMKKLEEPKEHKENQVQIKNSYQTDKEEIFDIYNKIKSDEYNIDKLDDEKKEKINAILINEIDIKKKKLDEKITELNMLKQENKLNEKERIMQLYYQVKDEQVEIESLPYEDLTKIRKLLLKESKLLDDKIINEISMLNVVVDNN